MSNAARIKTPKTATARKSKTPNVLTRPVDLNLFTAAMQCGLVAVACHVTGLSTTGAMSVFIQHSKPCFSCAIIETLRADVDSAPIPTGHYDTYALILRAAGETCRVPCLKVLDQMARAECPDPSWPDTLEGNWALRQIVEGQYGHFFNELQGEAAGRYESILHPIAYILIDKGTITGEEVAAILGAADAMEGKCANCGCDLEDEEDASQEQETDTGDIDIAPLPYPFLNLVAQVFGDDADAFAVEYADLDRIQGAMGDQHLTIRMWDVTETAIRWTLFRDVSNGDGPAHGEELRSGDLRIKVGN